MPQQNPTKLIGVDTYSFHRYFGETRSGEKPVSQRWSLKDTFEFCLECGAEIIGLETCFLPKYSGELALELRKFKENSDIELILSWGHPHGLKLGSDALAFEDAKNAIGFAKSAGIDMVRIVLGSPKYSFTPENYSRAAFEQLCAQARELCQTAKEEGLDIGIETHADMPVDLLLSLAEQVNQGNLYIVFDTVNVLRVGSTIEYALHLLASKVKVVHIKNVFMPRKPEEPNQNWWCVPLDRGDINIYEIVRWINAACGCDKLVCLVEVADVDDAICDELTIVRQGIEFLRNIRRRLDDGST